LTEHQKIVDSDHVGNPYGCAKFGANLSTGGLLGEWVKYDEILFIYTFLPATHLQVRPVDGFSRLMAQTTRTRLSGVSLILLPTLDLKYPQNPNLGRG